MTNKQKRWIALIGISLLSFTAYLDATIVSTALPSIQSSLHMNINSLQWVMNAFFLGISAFMASMGAIGDRFGRRLVFYIGLCLFALASLGAGLAQAGSFLVLCRAAQGITSAVSIIVGLSLIGNIFEGNEKHKAFSIYGAITGLGLALGPLVSSLLIAWFNWRAVFLVNIPFVILGLALCTISIPQQKKPTNSQKIDVSGIIFLALSMFLLTFSFIEANNTGWLSKITFACFTLSLFSFLILLWVERKAIAPILPGYLFKNKIFITCSLLALTGGGIMAISLFANPLYLHNILNLSILETGILLTVIAGFVVTGAKIVGILGEKIKKQHFLSVNFFMYTLTCVLYFFFSTHSSKSLIVLTFMIFGLAWGFFNVIAPSLLSTELSENHLGVGVGAIFTLYNVGASVVLAFGMSTFHLTAKYNLQQNLARLMTDKRQVAEVIYNFLKHPDQLQHIQHTLGPLLGNHHILSMAFMKGVHSMFFLPLLLCIIAIPLLYAVYKR